MKTVNYVSKWAYDMDWAMSVTKHCVDKYARATEILGACFCLFHKDFACMLAHNSPLWNISRSIMHYLEKICENNPKDKVLAFCHDYATIHLYSSTMARDAKFYEIDLVEVLTEFRTLLVLNSQGFRGY